MTWRTTLGSRFTRFELRRRCRLNKDADDDESPGVILEKQSGDSLRRRRTSRRLKEAIGERECGTSRSF